MSECVNDFELNLEKFVLSLTSLILHDHFIVQIWSGFGKSCPTKKGGLENQTKINNQ